MLSLRRAGVWFVVACAALALAALTLVWAPSASAQNSPYGGWAPEGDTPVYSSEIGAFNDEQLAEQSGFACVFSDGSTLSAADRQALSAIYLTGGDVYNGQWKPTYVSDTPAPSDPDRGSPPANGGYSEGSEGMNAFLRDEAGLLADGRWSYPRDRQIKKLGSGRPDDAYSYPKQGWALISSTESSPLSKDRQQRLSDLLPTDADNPLALTSTLPEACALTPLSPQGPQFGDLFASPGDFVLDTLLYAPASLASSAHNYIQPYAFKYTFWTPHTERGDLIWDQALACVPQGDPSRAYSSSDLQTNCDSSGAPLGFNGESSSGYADADRPWFLVAANFLQWLISGVYMLIFLTATVLYMLRGSRNTARHVMRLIPRLLASVVFVLLAGWAIGGLISASNFAVLAIFSFDDAPTVGAINTFLLQSGPIVGGSEFFQTLVSLFVGATTVFFYFLFFITALARQLILVALIILAPIAALAIIVPAWRSRFDLYLRALIGVIALPVLMALILRIGMSINPLITDPASAYGGLKGLLGLTLMLLTMYLMWKSISLTRSYIVRGGEAFRFNAPEEWRVALGGGRELAAAGASAGMAREGALIPAGREVSRPSDAPLVVAAKASGLQPASDLAPASQQPLPSDFKPVRAREVEEGVVAAHRRVSNETAHQHKASLREALAAAEEAAGGELSAEERDQVIAAHYAQNGRLYKKSGSWYLRSSTDERKELNAGEKSDPEGAEDPPEENVADEVQKLRASPLSPPENT